MIFIAKLLKIEEDSTHSSISQPCEILSETLGCNHTSHCK